MNQTIETTPNTERAEHWMPLLVRAEDYTDAAAWVAERESLRRGPSVSGGDLSERMRAEVETGKSATTPAWQEDSLVKLAAEKGRRTDERWAQVMELACENPRTPLATSEVAHLTGMTLNEWRDAQRKFNSKHIHLHYPGETGWPLASFWGGHVGAKDEIYVYATIEQADGWRQVRQNIAG